MVSSSVEVQGKASQATSSYCDVDRTAQDKASQTDLRQEEVKFILSEKNDEEKETKVFIRAEWSSCAREKQLPSDLCALSKMLVSGTLKKTAHAAWSSTCLKEFILKDLVKSVYHVCAHPFARKITQAF